MTTLAEQLSRDLGVDIVVAVASDPLPTSELTAAEEAAYRLLSPTTTRRRERLRGRAALREVFGALGDPPDAGAVTFPHPRLSLSHSDGIAVAVGCRGRELTGVGVDLERTRRLRAAAARFFLDAREHRWTQGLPLAEQENELLRLWTVKEAVFKADPANGGRRLHDYALADPGARVGHARIVGSYAAAGGWRYTTVVLPPPLGRPFLLTVACDSVGGSQATSCAPALVSAGRPIVLRMA